VTRRLDRVRLVKKLVSKIELSEVALHNADELVETGGGGVLRCALDLVSVESDSSDVRTCRVGDRASGTPHAAPCVKDSVRLGDAERLDEPELVP
jgi:hypothetical protein